MRAPAAAWLESAPAPRLDSCEWHAQERERHGEKAALLPKYIYIYIEREREYVIKRIIKRIHHRTDDTIICR